MGCIWVRLLCLPSLLPSLVTYLIHILPFSRGPWSSAFGYSWVLRVGSTLALSIFSFLSPPFFFLTHTSCLARMARTLLDGLEHATFNFANVVAPFFFVFYVCPMVLDLANQRRNIFRGVSEVGKNKFSFIFSGCASFSLLQSRDVQPLSPSTGTCQLPGIGVTAGSGPA